MLNLLLLIQSPPTTMPLLLQSFSRKLILTQKTSNNGPSLTLVPQATSLQPTRQPQTYYLLPCPSLPASQMVNVYALCTCALSTSHLCPTVLVQLTSTLAMPCTHSFCDNVQNRMHHHLHKDWVHNQVLRPNHSVRPWVHDLALL